VYTSGDRGERWTDQRRAHSGFVSAAVQADPVAQPTAEELRQRDWQETFPGWGGVIILLAVLAGVVAFLALLLR